MALPPVAARIVAPEVRLVGHPCCVS